MRERIRRAQLGQQLRALWRVRIEPALEIHHRSNVCRARARCEAWVVFSVVHAHGLPRHTPNRRQTRRKRISIARRSGFTAADTTAAVGTETPLPCASRA